VFYKKILERFDMIFFFLGFLANADVFCGKISENFDPFPYFHASWQLQNYLSNLNFVAGAEQLISKCTNYIIMFFIALPSQL